jgi:hypothetical protein
MGSSLTREQQDLAHNWFGYGQWAAPYWFIGIEPGGDDLDATLRMWNALGKGELLDIAAHHEEDSKDWFDERAGTQPTWAKLIWLLLAFNGKEPTREATLEYQQRSLGRSGRETALIEISSLPAKNKGVAVPRELYREERIQKIRARMIEHKPQFAVFYSPDADYRGAWNAIAGRELIRDEPVAISGTACVVTYHPNGERSKKYWSDLGNKLRAFRAG